MSNDRTARATISIQAPVPKVWEALTTAALIKQYFFGVDVLSDWQVGSPIVYRGEWQGKSFEDKGAILKNQPEKLLVFTHWSPLSGVPDSPENYHTVTYDLSRQAGGTQVMITQDNNASAQEIAESEKNWKQMLENLKKLLEN